MDKPLTESPQLEATHAAPILLQIGQIQPYEHNPRHGQNPEYDRIKDSIRSHGLDQALVITQRPGATNYIVHSGGNTRLLVLKELYEETGDNQFSQVQCLFKPWSCESDVLLAHLRENDIRGSLTFIDKARAVFEARQLIEAELGVDEISRKDLVNNLRSNGYSISRSAISHMTYAVQILLPLIPQALDAGMGKHQVERIRALERVARITWQRYCSGDESIFDSAFSTLCHRYDGADWNTDLLQGALEAEIAGEGDTSIHTVRVAFDAEFFGRELLVPEPEPEPIGEPEFVSEPEQHEKHDAQVAAPGVSENQDDCKDTEIAEILQNEELEDLPASCNTEVEDPPHNDLNAEPPASTTEPLTTINQSAPTDLKSLRSRAWTLAARLAQRNGIGDLVAPLSGKGLGFMLRDVPDSMLAEQLDDDGLSQISMLWWQLAACAEMTFAPLESIVPLLPANSVLRRALEEHDAGLLFNSVWTLDPGQTGYRLWHPLNDNDWSDLLDLMDTYRRIRHLAVETGTAIWD